MDPAAGRELEDKKRAGSLAGAGALPLLRREPAERKPSRSDAIWMLMLVMDADADDVDILNPNLKLRAKV